MQMLEKNGYTAPVFICPSLVEHKPLFIIYDTSTKRIIK